MQTILLATGENKVLQPLTDTIPSPMLPVLNRPVMSYQLELLARQGIEESLVCVHHLADQIERYFGTGEWWKVRLSYLLQPEPLGTAGSLKWAEHSLTDAFLCLRADAAHQLDLSALWGAHKASGYVATVVVCQRPTPEMKRYQISEKRQVVSQETKLPVWMNRYDTGAYLFEPQVLDFIPKCKSYDIYSQLIPTLLAAGFPVGSFELDPYYGSMDSFQNFASFQWHYLKHCFHNLEPSPVMAPDWKGREISKGVWVGGNHKIHPKARLSAPVVIGENVYIGRDAQVGPNAVIGSNVIIDDGATVTQSVVLDETYIGMLIKIENYLVSRSQVIDLLSETSLSISDPVILNDTTLKKISQKMTRLLDITAAALLLFILTPLQLIIVAWLLLTGSPVFQHAVYLSKQTRQSVSSSAKQLLTVRLAHFNASKPGSRWIERLEWHRIPELWSVLKGDLKLVGLSPLLVGGEHRIPEMWWFLRQSHEPGFTGLWYVQAGENDDLDDRLIADAYYLATRNFWRDVSIFLRTPFAWWKKTFRPRPSRMGKREGSHAV